MSELEIELCSHVCPRCGSCDRCCDGQCRSSDERASIEELIERSSIGTPEAQAIRESVPDAIASEIVERSKVLERSSDESEQR